MAIIKLTLAIDTDHFVISKISNMTEYITGQSYDGGSYGSKLRYQAMEEMTSEEWNEMYELVRTEYGESAVSGSWEEISTTLPTPGYYVHARNGIFKDGEEEAALADLNGLNVYDWQSYKRNMESRLRNLEAGNPLGLTPEDPCDLEWEIAKAELRIKRFEANRELHYGPAYLTLGLYLTQLPSPGILAVIKSRAEKFAAMKGFSILGYRLITERVAYTSEPI